MERILFGFWKEQGEDYLAFPSITDYLAIDPGSNYNKEKVIGYLKSGGVVCVTSSLSFPNVITGQHNTGSMAIRTDGRWEWPENLIDYIINHGLIIPRDWYEYMRSNNFEIPQSVKKENPDIEW